MYNELKGLFEGYSDRLAHASGLRGASERKDALSGIIRDVLRESTVRTCGGALYVYDGKAYARVEMNDVRDAVLNILSDMGIGASDLGRIDRVPYAELARKCCSMDRNMIAFRNGVYDVRNGAFRGFSKGIFTDWKLSYNYIPQGECRLWENFLSEILPDGQVRTRLQEFFGLCLADRGKVSVEKFALMIGSGANGKSVVCEVVKRVLGGDAMVDSLSPDQLQDPKQIVSLSGKVLNIAPDVRKGASFDSSIKALSSGQTVKGWRMYVGNVDVTCPPLAFAMNEMPYCKDLTPAFFRRLMLFRFNVTIPPEKQDRGLADRLFSKEAGGIFNWIAAGARRLMANKGMFSPCPSMDEDVETLSGTLAVEQSPLLSYLADNGWGTVPEIPGQKAETVPSSVLVDGMEGTMSATAITRELRKAGVKMTRQRMGIKYYLYRKNNGKDEWEKGSQDR